MSNERVFLLRNGGELIETEERILFSRSSAGSVPLLTDGNAEIDDVLDTLAWRESQIESLRAELRAEKSTSATLADQLTQEIEAHARTTVREMQAERERDEARQVAKQAGDYAEQRNKWIGRAKKAEQANVKLLEGMRFYADLKIYTPHWHEGLRIMNDEGQRARDLISKYDTAQCKHGDPYSKCADCQAEDYVMEMHDTAQPILDRDLTDEELDNLPDCSEVSMGCRDCEGGERHRKVNGEWVCLNCNPDTAQPTAQEDKSE